MCNQLIAVGVVTGIAQLAAFVKVWVTARLFGVGAQLDGYNLALVAPTLISGVLSGMLQTVDMHATWADCTLMQRLAAPLAKNGYGRYLLSLLG